ncbi:hypothetical protein ACWJKU_16650 [Methylocaldum sp. MU1018]
MILDDRVWEKLQQVPKGECSSLINQAPEEFLLRRRRQQAFARLRERAKTKERLPGTTEEWVREDRNSHR